MLTREDLLAIEEVLSPRFEAIDQRFEAIDQRFESMDQKYEGKFKSIQDRFDVIELKQNRTAKKLDNLQLDVKVAERSIRQELHKLNDEMATVIEVLKQNELIPR